MPIAKVGDINLYYEIHGTGEPLVLIRGFGFHGGFWVDVRDKFTKEYRVIVPDNRGTGRSDKPEIPYTAKMMAGDIAGLLDVLGIGAANVFGISLGGMIAQEFALSYPERLNNLILGCTSCGSTKSVPPTPEVTAFLWGLGDPKQSDEERVRSWIPWMWNKEFVKNNPAVIERLIATYCEYPTPLQAYVSQANVGLTFDTYDRLPDIKAPTLVIAGSKDRIFSCENSKLLASRIPNAKLAIIENAEHAFLSDSTEKASKIILDFLRRHSKARANN